MKKCYVDDCSKEAEVEFYSEKESFSYCKKHAEKMSEQEAFKNFEKKDIKQK